MNDDPNVLALLELMQKAVPRLYLDAVSDQGKDNLMYIRFCLRRALAQHVRNEEVTEDIEFFRNGTGGPEVFFDVLQPEQIPILLPILEKIKSIPNDIGTYNRIGSLIDEHVAGEIDEVDRIYSNVDRHLRLMEHSRCIGFGEGAGQSILEGIARMERTLREKLFRVNRALERLREFERFFRELLAQQESNAEN